MFVKVCSLFHTHFPLTYNSFILSYLEWDFCPPGFVFQLQCRKVVLFLPVFEDIGFEVLSLILFYLLTLTSIDISDLRRIYHMQLTSSSEYWADMLAAKMIHRRFGAQDVLGRPICLLRYKRICFPCTGDLDSTLCSHFLTKSGSCTSGTWV